ncbi:hypothetical protein ACFV0R_18010 [Streptomyces sp. NPDC059578]|uniref:hypothetical protein n=1 Tax=unclassified Streptomyces TaxID=2593676 RepID=UPI00365BD7B1
MTGEGLTVPVPRRRTDRCVRCARPTSARLPVQVDGRTRTACARCGPDLTPGPTWDEPATAAPARTRQAPPNGTAARTTSLHVQQEVA